MPKKHTKKTALKSPRTVQELAPWLDGQFGLLKQVVRSLADSNGQGAKPRLDSAPVPRSDDLVHQLAGCLHQAVSHLEILLAGHTKPALAESPTLNDLVRALLLTGNGEKFEPAVRAAIRDYSDTCEEVFRVSHHMRLPDEIREDILAGFTRVASVQKQSLRLLNITTEDVPKGTQLDTQRHQVVKHLKADEPEKLNTVRCGITPVFCWKNAYEQERLEPARVIAYTKLHAPDEPPVKPKHEPNPDPDPDTLFDAATSTNLF